MQKPSAKTKDWLKAGGALGAAILMARFTRTPLVTLLQAMPYLLRQMEKAYPRQSAPDVPSSVTRQEARLILGVADSASADDVREAHRRLIQKNHPDQGGTDYLAAKINQARDILLT